MQVERTQRDCEVVILASVVEKVINSGFQRVMVSFILSGNFLRERSWLGKGFPKGFQIQICSDIAFSIFTSSALVKKIWGRKSYFSCHNLKSQ